MEHLFSAGLLPALRSYLKPFTLHGDKLSARCICLLTRVRSLYKDSQLFWDSGNIRGLELCTIPIKSWLIETTKLTEVLFRLSYLPAPISADTMTTKETEKFTP